MNETKPTKSFYTSSQLVRESFLLWLSFRKNLLTASFLWFFLPQFITFLVGSYLAQESILDLQSMLAQPSLSIADTMPPVHHFLLGYGAISLAAVTCLCYGYILLLNTALKANESFATESGGAWPSELKKTLQAPLKANRKPDWKLVVKLIFLLTACVGVYLIASSLILFHLVAMVLLSVSPIVMLIENKGIFSSMKGALLLKYSNKKNQGGISLFFTLAGAYAILYFGYVVIDLFITFLSGAELNLGIGLTFMSKIKVLGIPLLGYLLSALEAFLFSVILGAVLCITVRFYGKCRKNFIAIY